ncbi:MAG: hypothetical protein AAGJ34_11760 [Pseudomonadota bacterium]
MAAASRIYFDQFAHLRKRQNELASKNLTAIRSAGGSSDRTLMTKLVTERAKIRKNDAEIRKAELAFLNSTAGQSDAERKLIKHASEANKMVGRINNITALLKSAGKMADILTRLIAALT